MVSPAESFPSLKCFGHLRIVNGKRAQGVKLAIHAGGTISIRKDGLLLRREMEFMAVAVFRDGTRSSLRGKPFSDASFRVAGLGSQSFPRHRSMV